MRTAPQDRALQRRLAAIAAAEDGPTRGGIPERWLQDPTWRCVNSHVAKQCNRGRLGRRECVFRFCTSVVRLTFPEDRSGPLG